MTYSLWRFLFCLKHELESGGKWKCAFSVASLLLPAGRKKKVFPSARSVCPPCVSMELNEFGCFSKQEFSHAAKISVKLQPSRCQIYTTDVLHQPLLTPSLTNKIFFWRSHPLLKLHFSLTPNFPHALSAPWNGRDTRCGENRLHFSASLHFHSTRWDMHHRSQFTSVHLDKITPNRKWNTHSNNVSNSYLLTLLFA